MDNPIIDCGGIMVPLDELKKDVEAAKEKNLSNQWAFTPETVDGLIDALERSMKQNRELEERLASIKDVGERWKAE